MHTNRSFAKDSSDLCRFGEGLRTSATRTPIRGDVDGTEKCLVVEGGGVQAFVVVFIFKMTLVLVGKNACFFGGLTFWLEKTFVFLGGG